MILIKLKNAGKKIEIFMWAFIAGMLLFLTVAAYSDRVQGEIAASVIRLHVLANSDGLEDQELKKLVRDAVLQSLEGSFTGYETIEESRGILESRLECIENLAADLTGQPVKAQLTQSFFPTLVYKNAALPAGIYETLHVSIGEASGRNWWCIVFPPLCLVDVVSGQFATAGAVVDLGGLMSAEAYTLVSQRETVRIRFKAVEAWQRLRNFFGGP